jgi:predicted permease
LGVLRRCWQGCCSIGRFADEAVLAMASACGNVVMPGIPLALTTLGPAVATPITVIHAIHTPALWLMPTLHVERAEHRSSAYPGRVINAPIKDLLRNPLIVGILAGSLWDLSGLGIKCVPPR